MSGQELAFPFLETAAMQGESINFGLTKRELFAAMAMQGIAAANEVSAKTMEGCWKKTALVSVGLADALLAELAKPQEPTP